MIYLASPYTGTEIQESNRALDAHRFTLTCLREGIALFSPIVYTANFDGLPGHFEAWQFMNDNAIKAAEAVWVLCLPGWENSRGVSHELDLARSLGKSIRFFSPEGDEIYADS